MWPRKPVCANLAARGMWYQRLSARSMPAARVPRVGTIHPAASAAQAPTATSLASPHEPGAGGSTFRAASSLGAISPAPTPATTIPASTAQRVNPPKVPSTSETHTNPTTPSTTSARRAGAPDHPGKSRARTL